MGGAQFRHLLQCLDRRQPAARQTQTVRGQEARRGRFGRGGDQVRRRRDQGRGDEALREMAGARLLQARQPDRMHPDPDGEAFQGAAFDLAQGGQIAFDLAPIDQAPGLDQPKSDAARQALQGARLDRLTQTAQITQRPTRL